MVIKTKEINVRIEPSNAFWDRTEKVFKDLDKGIFPKSETSVSFDNLELFKKTLTKKRLELLHLIKLNKPKSIYELSRIAKRDRKSITTDIKILKDVGLIEIIKEKTSRKLAKPILRYDEIKLGIKI